MFKLKGITKRYEQGKSLLCVFKAADWEIDTNVCNVLLGPSGSGKTTMMKIAAGLMAPDEGSVEFEGRDIYSLSGDELAQFRAQSISFVFQEARLFNQLSIEENVLLPLLAMKDKTNKRDRERARMLLDKTGILSKADSMPQQLSGGEKQRAALATAFINEPRFVFADEPTGSLDNETAMKLVDTLLQMNDGLKTGFLIVSHSMELAEKMHKRYAIKGKVIEEA